MVGTPHVGWRDPDSIRHNNFDFIRLFLAVVVIWSHSYDLLRGEAPLEPVLSLTGQMTAGTIAVSGFFVTSGFLVAHSWASGKGVWDFARKRCRRIYPAFVVALVMCVVVAGPLATDDPLRPFLPADLWKAVAGCITLRGDIQDYAVPSNPYPGTMNGSTWSIPYEVRCYAIVVLLAWARCLRRPGRLLTVFGISLAVAFCFDLFLIRFGNNLLSYVVGWPHTWAQLLPCFLAGMTFYYFRSKIPFSDLAACGCVIGLILGGWMPSGMCVTLPTCGAYLLFWFAYHPRVRLHGWGLRGDFSYGTYLYAFPIQQLLIRHFPSLRDPSSLFLVATALSIAAGWASWHLVEKRFLQRSAASSKPTRAASAIPQ